MKLDYYPETDSFYIELASRPGAETRKITDGLNEDLDAERAATTSQIVRAGVGLKLPPGLGRTP